MKSRIVFIRHGITVGNERKLYYGATDVSLSDRGMDILKELAAKGVYPDSDDAEYYTSGMLRTEQTFKILYGDKPHTKIGNLRELNFGKFEMKTYNELDKDLNAQLEQLPEHIGNRTAGAFKGERGFARGSRGVCGKRTGRQHAAQQKHG